MNKDLISNAGMYYVCYLLSTQGWNAMPTTKNAKGVDIVAYNNETNRTVSIQVKTKLSARGVFDVPLGNVPRDVDAKEFLRSKVLGDYWAIVRLDKGKLNNQEIPVYIIPRKDIINTLALPPVSDTTKHNTYWLASSKGKDPDKPIYTADKYKNAWHLIK